MIGKQIDYVFLGAVPMVVEDFRAFASIVKEDKKQLMLRFWLVPGHVKEEGILDILTDADSYYVNLMFRLFSNE
jgi:aconitase B